MKTPMNAICVGENTFVKASAIISAQMKTAPPCFKINLGTTHFSGCYQEYPLLRGSLLTMKSENRSNAHIAILLL